MITESGFLSTRRLKPGGAPAEWRENEAVFPIRWAGGPAVRVLAPSALRDKVRGQLRAAVAGYVEGDDA